VYSPDVPCVGCRVGSGGRREGQEAKRALAGVEGGAEFGFEVGKEGVRDTAPRRREAREA